MPSATFQRPYIHNKLQEEPARGMTSADEGVGPAVHSITSIKKTVRLYKNIQGLWVLDLHDGTAPAVLANQAAYDPQFRVCAISVKDTDDTGVTVIFDEPDSWAVIERFIFGVDRAFNVTRVHIGTTAMTATDINLHGN